MGGRILSFFRKKPTPTENHSTPSEIENQIDDIVRANFGRFKNLMEFNGDVKFWQKVIKSIAWAESEFNPNESYFEKTMGYYSLGLLQLSYEDYTYYNFKDDPEKAHLFDVYINIKLGLIILDRQIYNHGKFIFDGGNYWATLKPSNKRYQVYLDRFNSYR